MSNIYEFSWIYDESYQKYINDDSEGTPTPANCQFALLYEDFSSSDGYWGVLYNISQEDYEAIQAQDYFNDKDIEHKLTETITQNQISLIPNSTEQKFYTVLIIKEDQGTITGYKLACTLTIKANSSFYHFEQPTDIDYNLQIAFLHNKPQLGDFCLYDDNFSLIQTNILSDSITTQRIYYGLTTITDKAYNFMYLKANIGWIRINDDIVRQWYVNSPVKNKDDEGTIIDIPSPQDEIMNPYKGTYMKLLASNSKPSVAPLSYFLEIPEDEKKNYEEQQISFDETWQMLSYKYTTGVYTDKNGNLQGLTIVNSQTQKTIAHRLPSSSSNTCNYNLEDFVKDADLPDDKNLLGYFATIYHNGVFMEQKFLKVNAIIEQAYSPTTIETYKYILDPIYAHIELTGVQSNNQKQIYQNEIPALTLSTYTYNGLLQEKNKYHSYFKYVWQEKPYVSEANNSIKFSTTYSYQLPIDRQPPRLFPALNQKGNFIGEQMHYARNNYEYRCKILLPGNNSEVFAYTDPIRLQVINQNLPLPTTGVLAGVKLDDRFQQAYGFYIMTEDGWEPLNFNVKKDDKDWLAPISASTT